MTAIAQALTAALLHFVWQGLLVALLLWTALFLLRKRSSNARYLAACAALAFLAVLPVITASVLYTRPIAAPVNLRFGVSEAPAFPAPSGGGVPQAAWLELLQSWALPAWSLGVLLFSVRMVWGCRQVSVLRRRGEPAAPPVLAAVLALGERLGIARPVHVLITAVADGPSVVGPSVVGALRPVILLPSATLLGLTTEQLEAVLAHELAHIRRHDYLVNLLQTLVETLLFYHPAVWWTSARIRHERELCCDDLAVRSCGDPLCYARALTRLERIRVMTPSLAMGSNGGSMLYRVQRLMGAGTHEYGPSKLPGILALSLALACFALNLDWARGQERSAPGILIREATTDHPGVSVDLGGAAVIHRSSVEYPGPAIEKGIQGTVVVEATLNAAGDVEGMRVMSGPTELRRVALQSVLEWRFVPSTAGTVRQVSITFDLAAAQTRERERPTNQYENLAVAYALKQGEPEQQEQVSQIEARIAELKARLEQVHAKLADQALESDSSYKAETVQLQAQLQDTLRELASQREAEHHSSRTITLNTREGTVTFNTASPAGRTLVSIDIIGLPQAGAELKSRLPVHIGDTLSPELMEKITKAVRDFDEHLELNFFTRQGSEGDAYLRIAAPGRLSLRQN